jgi:hypothetical protein
VSLIRSPSAGVATSMRSRRRTRRCSRWPGAPALALRRKALALDTPLPTPSLAWRPSAGVATYPDTDICCWSLPQRWRCDSHASLISASALALRPSGFRSRNGTTNLLNLTSLQVAGSAMYQSGQLISFRLHYAHYCDTIRRRWPEAPALAFSFVIPPRAFVTGGIGWVCKKSSRRFGGTVRALSGNLVRICKLSMNSKARVRVVHVVRRPVELVGCASA